MPNTVDHVELVHPDWEMESGKAQTKLNIKHNLVSLGSVKESSVDQQHSGFENESGLIGEEGSEACLAQKELTGNVHSNLNWFSEMKSSFQV